jgi:uncharacterized protein YjbJ (UPF0337 family)
MPDASEESNEESVMKVFTTIMLALALAAGTAGGALAVDKDRVDGSLKQMKGKVESKAGDITGDAGLKSKGRKDRVTGKVQNTWGNVKDGVRDATR